MGEQAGTKGTKWLVVSMAVAGLVAGGVLWHREAHRPSIQPVQQAGDVTPPPAKPALAAAPALPPEAQADSMMRKFATGLSDSQVFASWLQETDLARRVVATVDAVADDDVPRNLLSFMAPRGRFLIDRRGGHTFISPRSYHRFDVVARTIASLHVDAAAEAYKSLHPLLEAAYRELGSPKTTLDGRLAEAIAEVESVQAPAGPMEVVLRGASYRFADEKLESSSVLSRQLLRMGPKNMKLIQGTLRALAGALHLPTVASNDRAAPSHG